MQERYLRWAAALGFLICFANEEPALAAGSVQRGKTLAEERCVNCHIVGRNAPNAIESQPVGPDFMTMKNLDAAALKATLRKSHPVMSKFPNLSNRQIADLVSYIASVGH